MPHITPFSNGTEAHSWLAKNCDICTRQRCYTKKCIEMGFIIGTITQNRANWIGLTNNRLNTKCNYFNKPNKTEKKAQHKNNNLTDSFNYKLF